MNMKEAINFKTNFDDVQQIAHFDNSDDEEEGGRQKGNSKAKGIQKKVTESQLSIE